MSLNARVDPRGRRGRELPRTYSGARVRGRGGAADRPALVRDAAALVEPARQRVTTARVRGQPRVLPPRVEHTRQLPPHLPAACSHAADCTVERNVLAQYSTVDVLAVLVLMCSCVLFALIAGLAAEPREHARGERTVRLHHCGARV